MLWIASDLVGHAIEATDGKIGSVEDFLYDDRHWAIRWAAIDTGDWLPGRTVLLPPAQLGSPDPDRSVFRVALTRAQVEASPAIAADPPVSRQMEAKLYEFYGWAPYWQGDFAAPGMALPIVPPAVADTLERDGDPHLRGTGDTISYTVQARDGEIGHIEDFLIDSDAWAVRYLVVATRNWWPGKNVLIAPSWVSDISWSERTVRFDMTRERIKASPAYDPSAFDRGYEQRLHAHYDQPTYWL
jgi:hypothetical protein